MENCRAEGRNWAKKIMKWYLTWICSDKEKINLFCFIHCVSKWEGGESARLNWWVWLLPLQACSRFDYNPTISQIHKYQISPMILTAQSLTRSSCLNSALRDDEAVYRVCKGHYEAVAVGGGQWRASVPLYIEQSGDLDRCYRCLTHWLTDSLTTLKDINKV